MGDLFHVVELLVKRVQAVINEVARVLRATSVLSRSGLGVRKFIASSRSSRGWVMPGKLKGRGVAQTGVASHPRFLELEWCLRRSPVAFVVEAVLQA